MTCRYCEPKDDQHAHSCPTRAARGAAGATGTCGQCGVPVYEEVKHLCAFDYQPSLRDHFAMAAPLPIATDTAFGYECNAAKRYVWADAMMIARQK